MFLIRYGIECFAYDANKSLDGEFQGPVTGYYVYFSEYDAFCNRSGIFICKKDNLIDNFHRVAVYDIATYATAVPSGAVPEPLTILGSITATGFVAAFNRIKNKKEE